jgi:hypothetical protein
VSFYPFFCRAGSESGAKKSNYSGNASGARRRLEMWSVEAWRRWLTWSHCSPGKYVLDPLSLLRYPLPPGGYFGRISFGFSSLQGHAAAKILILNDLSIKYFESVTWRQCQATVSSWTRLLCLSWSRFGSKGEPGSQLAARSAEPAVPCSAASSILSNSFGRLGQVALKSLVASKCLFLLENLGV